MLVGDSLVSGEFLDADNSDLDLLEDEHQLIASDSRDKDEDKEEIDD